MSFEQRIEKVKAAMDGAGVEALLLTPGANLSYLTGFEHGHGGERLLGLMLPRDGAPTWIVPEMSRRQVPADRPPGARVRAWSDAEWYLPALKEALIDAKALTGTVAVEDEMRAAFLLELQQVAPGARCLPAARVLRDLRARKDEAELAAMRASAEVVDSVIPLARRACRPGATEKQVAEAIEAAVLERAPTARVAFCIVASGPNGALPHHDTGDRALEQGDVVIMDYGCRLDGYHSDITLTVSLGEPEPEARGVYEIVYRAQQAGLAAIRAGVPAQEVDRAARSVIREAGYGEYFLHRTGHGIGLQVHEPPYLLEGNRQPLEVGNCFSCEPGIYLEGRFGVRLEVLASVGPDGAVLLNAPSSAELINVLEEE